MKYGLESKIPKIVKKKENNDCLYQKKEKEFKNKNIIINRLNSQINLLKNDLFKYQQDKKRIKQIFENEKIINDNKIYDLSKILEKLNNENKKLKENTLKNKKINTKLNEDKIILINKIKNITRDLYKININITKQQKNASSTILQNNLIYSNILKKENNDLKQIQDKYRKILYILFQFINEINYLNENPEIEIEQSYNNISLLMDNINRLRKDILELLEQKYNNYENNFIEK